MPFWSPDELASLMGCGAGFCSYSLLGCDWQVVTSGGLMAGLNIAFAAANPINALDVIGMTATTFAKLGYNAKVKASRKALDQIKGHNHIGVKEPSKIVTKELVEDMVARIGGLTAMETQGQ